MRRSIKILLYSLVVFNAGLVIISWLIANHAVNQFPPHGEWVDVNGTRLHLVDSGKPSENPDAPTVVLLHGASTSARDFSNNLHNSLADHFHVISVDRPGHGYSERGDFQRLQSAQPDSQWMDPSRQARLILAALNARDISNPVLLGHSWAGSVVLAALLQQDADVRAGVLIAGATHPWQGESALHVKLAAHEIIGPVFSWQYIAPLGSLMMHSGVAEVMSPDKVPAGYASDTGLLLTLRPTSYQHNAEDLHHLNRYLETQATQYSQIEQPVLSIVGNGDTVVPRVSHHDKLALLLPQLESLAIDNAGHAPHHTRKETVHEAIVSFINALTSTPLD